VIASIATKNLIPHASWHNMYLFTLRIGLQHKVHKRSIIGTRKVKPHCTKKRDCTFFFFSQAYKFCTPIIKSNSELF